MSAPEVRIVRATGSLVEVRPAAGAALYDRVAVGERRLLGEVIRIDGDRVTIQVYEDTTGLRLGEPVFPGGEALTVDLGPGLLGSTLDGIGRPLAGLAATSGDFLEPGSRVPTLDPGRRWEVVPAAAAGEVVGPGDVLATVEERGGFVHRVMVPPDRGGRIARLEAGRFTVGEPFGELDDGVPLRLAHAWPVRRRRPAGARLRGDRPMLTGQRVFDFLFPVAEGGAVAVPGGFGTGKTVIEQSLAKFAAADVVVYVGCGERGNEMAEVLEEFPRLVDPRTGGSLLDRTILVVNTSNMPVAAREASVYLGMTLAEYYRDMGYRVAVMADSLSRWAEAMREIAARLQEMPGEEGYPTVLGSRLAALSERAGRIRALGRPERSGAVTFVAAISPPGGDFSEPVTQAMLRAAGAIWALDPALAHQRQFPAVDWETSYSLYVEPTAAWFREHVGEDWDELRREALRLLERERELREVAGLVGLEALQESDRLLLEAARILVELVLGQSAFDENDSRSPIGKTRRLAALALGLYREGARALGRGVPLAAIDLGPARRALAAFRAAPEADAERAAAAAEAAVAALAGPEGAA